MRRGRVAAPPPLHMTPGPFATGGDPFAIHWYDPGPIVAYWYSSQGGVGLP